MQLQHLKTLYESGRYECDIQFYNKLLSLVKYLNLYQYQTKISKNIEIVTKIVQLTQQHSNSLSQQYDEDKALDTTKKIQNQLGKIDLASTSLALKQCSLMNGQPFYHKIRNTIINLNDCSADYLQITQRVWKTINSQQLRVDSLMLVTLFMMKNKNNLKNFIKKYGLVLQKGLQLLKQYPEKLKFINENQQIKSHKKVISYIEGNIIIITILLRFYSVLKVIEGRSTIAFKLNSIKQEIQNSLKNFSSLSIQSFMEEEIPIDAVKKVLLGCHEQLKIINNCCKWCLRPGADYEGSHKICLQVIQLLS